MPTGEEARRVAQRVVNARAQVKGCQRAGPNQESVGKHLLRAHLVPHHHPPHRGSKDSRSRDPQMLAYLNVGVLTGEHLLEGTTGAGVSPNTGRPPSGMSCTGNSSRRGRRMRRGAVSALARVLLRAALFCAQSVSSSSVPLQARTPSCAPGQERPARHTSVVCCLRVTKCWMSANICARARSVSGD